MHDILASIDMTVRLLIFGCHDQNGETSLIEHMSQPVYCGNARSWVSVELINVESEFDQVVPDLLPILALTVPNENRRRSCTGPANSEVPHIGKHPR